MIVFSLNRLFCDRFDFFPSHSLTHIAHSRVALFFIFFVFWKSFGCSNFPPHLKLCKKTGKAARSAQHTGRAKSHAAPRNNGSMSRIPLFYARWRKATFGAPCDATCEPPAFFFLFTYARVYFSQWWWCSLVWGILVAPFWLL